jgi:hypothetical protein
VIRAAIQRFPHLAGGGVLIRSSFRFSSAALRHRVSSATAGTLCRGHGALVRLSSCLKNEPWNALAKMLVKASLPAHKPESLSEKKWTTSARGSTALVPPNKPSRSDSPKHVAPASSSEFRKKTAPPRELVPRHPVTFARVGPTGRRLPVVLVRPAGLSKGKGIAQLRVLRFLGRRARLPARVVRATVTVPPRKRLGRKVHAGVLRLLARLPARALARGREGSRALARLHSSLVLV